MHIALQRVAVAPPSVAGRGNGAQMKILVFANEKRAAGRLRALLQEQGHEVEIVRENGAGGAPASSPDGRSLHPAIGPNAGPAPRCERARTCPARIVPSPGLAAEKVFRPDAVLMPGQEAAGERGCLPGCEQPGGVLACLELVGDSAAAHALRAAVRSAAGSVGPVVIIGESGAGHEPVARALHLASSSRAGPFVRAGAGPGALGISRITEAALAAAAGGTLYLDGLEPPEARRPLAELLSGHRQQQQVRIVVGVPAGRGAELPEVFAGERPPTILLPPLRDRLEDLPALIELLFVRHSEIHGSQPVRPDAAWIARATAHEWPGNLWELESVVERAVVLAAGGEAARFDEVIRPPEAPAA